MEFDRRKRHPKDARSKLEFWVLEQGGPSRVALQLGVSHTAVGLWTAKRAVPSLPIAIKILDLAKGYLTVRDILEGSLREPN